MRINTQINVLNMKLNTPEYYILIHNIIDYSINLVQARYILDNTYKVLSKQVDDIELQRMYRLYKLFIVCKRCNKLNNRSNKIENKEDEDEDEDEEDEDTEKYNDKEIEEKLPIIERPSILRLITNNNCNSGVNCGRNYGVRYERIYL